MAKFTIETLTTLKRISEAKDSIIKEIRISRKHARKNSADIIKAMRKCCK